MDFRIADTFTDSLARLTGEEQKLVKTAAFDLQLNPSSPGFSFHKLDRARDKNFWSVRVSSDLRLIVHRTSDSLLLCYVDHHDKAYAWAEKRKLEVHPRTGAAQMVEIRERVEEITIKRQVEAAELVPAKPLVFANCVAETILAYGVPQEWVEDVLAATEDTLLDLVDHLPSEAAEALLNLATGTKPPAPVIFELKQNPFDHPDAQRRFSVMVNVEELERALNYPWDKWTIFLHPAQRELVERSNSGPVRISGSAGTGKTIVALHRIVFLARSNPDARVLLTTFSDALANALEIKLRRLISNEPRLKERIDVAAMDAVGLRLYELNFGKPQRASRATIEALLSAAAEAVPDHKFSRHFLLSEWEEVVDAWQVHSWEEYRDVRRLGRKTRLPEKQRAVLWSIFEQVRVELKNRGLVTNSELYSRLAALIAESKNKPFDYIVVDEAQDIGIAQLRFLAAFRGVSPDSLFFTGDLGQRIFQQPFSWKALGVDIRGRSKTLKINYRTSHQIRTQADRLLAPELADVDGNTEERAGTVSVFNGPAPLVGVHASPEDEIKAVSAWLSERVSEGMKAHELGVFVRSDQELARAKAAVEQAQLPFKILDEKMDPGRSNVAISTMHLAKGLEFRAVAVMACDDEVIPSQHRIEMIADEADLEEVYNTERQLLYVACTRARDHLMVTSVDPASEFLDDLVV